MVRINLINPRKLSDQHLIAEYNDILMLLGYVRKNPDATNIPNGYVLGKGHIKFFKNKLKYLSERHELIRKEMNKRGFETNKILDLKGIDKILVNDWKPKKEDIVKINERIAYKINLKPNFYRYCGEYKDKEFFIELLN
ncbi:MAG: pyrimidine dimer DNA glycosylase/endonuclease V [Nanoarchaeota archaeon]